MILTTKMDFIRSFTISVFLGIVLILFSGCFDCSNFDCYNINKTVNFSYYDEVGIALDFRELGLTEEIFKVYNIGEEGDTTQSVDSYIVLDYNSELHLDNEFNRYLMVISDTLKYSINVYSEIVESKCCGGVIHDNQIELNGVIVCDDIEECEKSFLKIVIPI